MDPIGSITKITGAVLRRIADAIDNDTPHDPAVTIHIGVLHVHAEPADLPLVDADRTVRNRLFRRS
ncbi:MULTISPECIES: hypothetical protein [Rhodococcus]|uniref:hypothetical protein n=1 Tax=Rhodococcus TaxID=1827 RepID=UPI001E305C3B|nr:MULTISPECIES: hypothetical protein [Rhodococcus]BDB58967.1 hypothetical protein RDE2_07610 [Rhodococcus sp. RDE2]